ncbi:MAG: DNA polymerase II [Phycisphaerales bacterium]|nr:DNA polymerase II [Phycisphaerales bacterium]
MHRGFVLQPTYRIESGRPVVHVYGVLDDGRSFLVRDSRSTPHFWIRRSDAETARRLGLTVDTDEPRRTMLGEETARIDVPIPGDVPARRRELEAAGVVCFEADVRFAYRYLIERGIRGTLEIDGVATPGDGVGLVFDDPRVGPADGDPTLRTLSIDIETNPTADRILSIALVGGGTSDVLLLTEPGQTCPDDATPCPNERALLTAFAERVRVIDPDVITGWNVIDFDLAVLLRRAQALGVPLRIGRASEPLRLRPANVARGGQQATMPGRVVLDGIDLLRGAFVRLESYALNAAAKAILGKQKAITGRNRAGAIMHAFTHDRPHLVAYNRRDAELVLEILDELDLIPLTVERSRLTGMPPDRVAASVASFDFLYLTALSRRRLVAPSVGSGGELEEQAGGHVLEPQPGLYRNVLLLDFKSLYPSVIRTFNIDPLALIEGATASASIVAPNGAAFSRRPGILPAMLDELFPQRESAKQAGNAVASHAIKILMNSFYGVLGTSTCRFAAPQLANAITGFGRAILLWTKGRIEARGHEVLYGDTDSLFVRVATEDEDEANRLGRRLTATLNEELATHVHERWGVTSRLELEFETLYLRLFLPAARGSTSGARKRYAGLIRRGEEPEVVFTGMEVVRRDWTELARQVQRVLYERLFTDRPVATYLRNVVAAVRAGEHDDLLVYRKGLRRKLETYTATTPPHVAAARKLRGRPGRVIAYVMTRDGPEPAEERRSPLDHEHYVQRQVRAVADPVLALLGLEFDRVVGDERQMLLFENPPAEPPRPA